MEQKHPHRVAIEYLVEVIGNDQGNPETRFAAAQTLLNYDTSYHNRTDQPINWTCVDKSGSTATFEDKDYEPDNLPKLEVITGRLGRPVQLKVSIPGEPEKFPGRFIEFPALPEDADAWTVYGGSPEQMVPLYRIESDGTVVDLQADKAAAEYAADPKRKDEPMLDPPWELTIADKLVAIRHLGHDHWIFTGHSFTGCTPNPDNPREISGSVIITIEDACAAVGEEVPKPRMKATYKRFGFDLPDDLQKELKQDSDRIWMKNMAEGVQNGLRFERMQRDAANVEMWNNACPPELKVPEPMTLGRAVEILNNRHYDGCNWTIEEGAAVGRSLLVDVNKIIWVSPPEATIELAKKLSK